MTVLRVTNPQVLELPEIKDILEAAFGFSIYGNADMDAVFEDATNMINDPFCGVFIGFDEEGLPKTLGAIQLPQNRRVRPIPQIITFFNSGSAVLKAEVIKAGVDFMRDNGYIKFWAINGTGHSDAAWLKVFAQGGATGKIGSIIEFEIE